jgi:hypothetical protein
MDDKNKAVIGALRRLSRKNRRRSLRVQHQDELEKQQAIMDGYLTLFRDCINTTKEARNG